MLVGKISETIIIFWLSLRFDVFISLQDSYVYTDVDLPEKLSLSDVIDEDSRQSIEDSYNEAVEVSKETEAQELLHVSTIKLSKI